jgi:hypothetical protein
LLVAHQVAVFLQRREMSGDLLAQLRITGLLLECAARRALRVSAVRVPFDCRCGFLGGSFAAALDSIFLTKASKSVAPCLQGIDEEADQRQLLGKLLEVGSSGT